MSQQEFAPGPQSQQPGNEDEIYQPHYPYSWSGNRDSEPAPRDEPPSSYEYNPSAMEQGYQGQDIAAQQQQLSAANPYEYQQPAQQQLSPQYQYNPYGNDGDNYEQGYSPYNSSYNAAQNNQGQGVPPWAQPQPRQSNPFRFGWLIFLLIMISMGSGLFRFGFIWGFGHLFGIIFLPIFMLMIIASIISRAMWGGGRRGGWRRRGPWGW
ncbi:MAG: hypothetical protein NVS3B14_23310 [Ktedonobacteraceae bacterium]